MGTCSGSSAALQLLALVLLAGPLVPVARAGPAVSSKHACDYSNRLCQWPSSYMFGSVVMGNKVFFNGGILGDDANTPVNGSAFQVLDLASMSPYIMQVEASSSLHTSRYRHQLVAWRDQILAVGGQVDDKIGTSQQVLNVISLDLNTRRWKLIKNFTQPSGPADKIFEASVVAGDMLLIVFQQLNQTQPSRQMLPMNLTNGDIDYNYQLFVGVNFLDWPLVGVMALTPSGDYPYLVVQAMRQLPNATTDTIEWSEVVGPDGGEMVPDETGELAPSGIFWSLTSSVAAPGLKKLRGGSGGKTLTLSILQVARDNKLVLWANTTAAFAAPVGSQRGVNVVSVYDIAVNSKGGKDGKPSVALTLSRLFMTLPLGIKLAGLQSIDLPLHGNMAVPPSAVTVLPYVGEVDLISDQDSSNVNIQSSGSGLVIRGSGIAAMECEPGATWRSFVMHVSLSGQEPAVRAVSNNTWCETREEQELASQVVSDGAKLGSGASRLYRAAGASLMVLNPQSTYNPGGQLFEPSGPLRGAHINLDDNSVQGFSAPTGSDYSFPAGVASCVTTLQGQSVYVEQGGYFTDVQDEYKQKASPAVFAMAANPGKPHKLQVVPGTSGGPATAHGSMACTPEGTVYLFGGLRLVKQLAEEHLFGYDENGEPVTATIYTPVWAASNSLHSFQLQGSASRPTAGSATELFTPSRGSVAPSARAGHALVHLPASTVSRLGMSRGALLLYGGSSVNQTSLTAWGSVADMRQGLNDSAWDRSVWLFDIAAGKWQQLRPAGQAPPGLVYHSMALQDKQAMMWGGLAFQPQNLSLARSTDLFVLDFSEAAPRWRQAAVDNINGQGAAVLESPNTGIVPLREYGAVALMHRSGVSLAPIPQSLKVDAQQQQGLAAWGSSTLNLTAGDWIRLHAPSSGLILEQPLFIGGDVVLSGVGSEESGARRRDLLQQPARGGMIRNLAVRCGRNTTSAVVIRSPGAQLEDMVISGCNGSAVDIGVDATGAYGSPAVLRNVSLTRNTGRQGSAINIGLAASAELQDCRILDNTATGSIVYSAQQSSLTLINSFISNSNATAVAFEGQSLRVERCTFANNRANATNGGCLRAVYPDAGAHSLSSSIDVLGSSFVNCSAAKLGGAIHLGSHTTARLANSLFTSCSANEGGAVMADRDACLAEMAGVNFTGNMANKSGGAVLMRSPSCIGAVTWNNSRFTGNTAGGDGGALYLTEASNRVIRGSFSHFVNNTADGTVAGGGGNGGALYLGMWASSASISNSNFSRNTASARGGAVNGLVIDSSINLTDVTADDNHAGHVHLAAADPADARLLRRSVTSEGGALAVQGSVAHVHLLRANLLSNTGGRGGAVSLNSDRGSLTSVNSSFSSNTAWTAGGGLAVTDRKVVSLVNTSFEANTLLWPELAAGGGFYCFLCESVALAGCSFAGNKAAYGGGAAVLQPQKASRITGSHFTDNEAFPELAAPRTGRAVLQLDPFVGPPAVFPGNESRLQQSALAILGPVGSNTTGDTGFYTGGGGLYLTLTAPVDLSGSSFVGNKAFNGGGLLARTDACREPGNLGSCSLTMADLAVQGNAANAGGGLLVTNISSSVVRLAGCPAGTALNAQTARACLQDNTNWAGGSDTAGHSGRGLLAAAGDQAAAAQSNSAPTGALLLTSAASMDCSSVQNQTGVLFVQREACGHAISAAPGLPFSPQFTLINGLGEPVSGDIYDASMPMRVELLNTSGDPLPGVQVLGDATQAANGVATFTGLSVAGSPFVDGGRYKLRFTTASGLSLTRDLAIRRCQAGEATRHTNNSKEGYTCEPCTAPTYSFFPDSSNCSQCANLRGPAEVCNSAAVVPGRGYYQSHPRNPLIRKCITASACYRSATQVNAMWRWAYLHANLTPSQMQEPRKAPLYLGYMDHMCAEGYTGPLCGSCQAGPQRFGHSAHLCVKCLSPAVNSFLYFLVCCTVLLIPGMQMLMHSKNVRKRSQQQQQLAAAAAAAKGGSATGPGGSQLSTVASAREQQQLGSVASGRHEQLPCGPSLGAVNVVNASPGKPGKAVTVSVAGYDVSGPGNDQQQQAPAATSAWMPIGTAAGSTALAPQPELSLSPFARNQSVPAEANGSATNLACQPGLSAAVPPSGAVTAQPSAAPFLAHAPRGPAGGLINRLFDVTSLDEEIDLWNTAKMSSTSPSGTVISAQLSAAPTAISVVPGATGRVHRRSFKFWHTDVLTMVVSYMQLLGLLRLIRIDWPKELQSWLIYLDVTSGATTWVSLECSLEESPIMPRSIKRTIFLLLWPLMGLGALAVYWLAYTGVLRLTQPHAVRRQQHRRHYLAPHMVMSSVILLYFLYTPTSREIISLFSCQPVDSAAELLQVAPEAGVGPAGLALPPGQISPQAQIVLRNDTSGAGSRWPGYWTSDTAVQCGSATHLGVALGLGVPGLLFFVIGLPVALWLVLRRFAGRLNHDGQRKLEDPRVELMYGLMYDKYRYRCYYWECVVLLENCCLTALLVMLQSQPAQLQVLVAMVVIFIEAVLHITFQPYGCRMLDTLRRISVFGLFTTLFLIMLASLDEFDDTTRRDRLRIACIVLIAAVNLAVLGLHAWACARELHRWLLMVVDTHGRGRITWADLRRLLASQLGLCGRRRSQRQQAAATAGAGAGGRAAGGGWRPPQESAVGGVHVVHQPAGATHQRTGDVIVVHTSPDGMDAV